MAIRLTLGSEWRVLKLPMRLIDVWCGFRLVWVGMGVGKMKQWKMLKIVDKIE
jgi:hypothetical protein